MKTPFTRHATLCITTLLSVCSAYGQPDASMHWIDIAHADNRARFPIVKYGARLVGHETETVDASTLWINAYGMAPAWAHLNFGNRIGNTWGLDTAESYPLEYRENLPPPPAPEFEAIWSPIRGGQFGSYYGLWQRDYRDYSSPLQKDTFKLSFGQFDHPEATISFKWPDAAYLSAHCDSLKLRYVADTGTVWIDMFAQDSLTIPMAGSIGIASMWIYKTGVHLVETGVREDLRPEAFSLEQNYPNPFNPETKIRYSVAMTAHVSLKIFDLLGREVATLVNETLPPGSYTVRWDAGSASSGVYICRIQAGVFVSVKKLILAR